MEVTLTHAALCRARRALQTYDGAIEIEAKVQAEIATLVAAYLAQVHTTIPEFEGSHSLAYWRAYFQLASALRTPAVRARLAYARETKVVFDVSEALIHLITKGSLP